MCSTLIGVPMKSLHPISFTSWKDALNSNVRDRYFRHRYDDSHKNATILSTHKR